MSNEQDARRAFVDDLYRLGAAAEHGNPDARRTLAQLHRGLHGPPRAATLELVYRHEPPEQEASVWLLTAGLFTINAPAASSRVPLGQAMGQLRNSVAADARLRQLMSVSTPEGLERCIRQVVQLVSAERIALDFAGLLDDVGLLHAEVSTGADAREVRMRWAREFHRSRHAAASAEGAPRSTTPSG